jgi:hypothetical protein
MYAGSLDLCTCMQHAGCTTTRHPHSTTFHKGIHGKTW